MTEGHMKDVVMDALAIVLVMILIIPHGLIGRVWERAFNDLVHWQGLRGHAQLKKNNAVWTAGDTGWVLEPRAATTEHVRG